MIEDSGDGETHVFAAFQRNTAVLKSINFEWEACGEDGVGDNGGSEKAEDKSLELHFGLCFREI